MPLTLTAQPSAICRERKVLPMAKNAKDKSQTPHVPLDKEGLQEVLTAALRKGRPWAAVLITFFGLTSFFSYDTLKEFKASKTELQAVLDAMVETADDIRRSFRQQRELYDMASTLDASAAVIRSRAEALLDDPNGVSDSLGKVVAYAYLLHFNDNTTAAIDRLRSVAAALEGVDDEQAASAWYVAGNMLQDIENGNEEVLALFDEAIRLNPEYFQAYNNRGIEKANLGYYDAASADFAEAIRLRPNDFQGYTNRATMHAERGNHVDALRDFEAARERAPDNAIIYMDIAASQAELGRIEEACAGFTTALRLARESGNPDLAENILRQSLEIECNL